MVNHSIFGGHSYVLLKFAFKFFFKKSLKIIVPNFNAFSTFFIFIKEH